MFNTIDWSRHKNAKTYSAAWWSYRFACTIMAYVPPVPEGGFSVEQRDLLAIQLGRKTAQKSKQGVETCIWHELALYHNRPCDCMKCQSIN